jgi:hypothetical protein
VKRGRCVMLGGKTLAGAKEDDAVVSENAIGGDLSMFLTCTVGGVGSTFRLLWYQGFIKAGC